MNKLNCAGLVVSMVACFSVSATYAADAASPKMQYIAKAQKSELPSMNVEGTKAFLKDLVGNSNKNMPFACGLFRMEKGKPLTYTYEYDEAKIVLEGTITVSDGSSTIKAKAGDVLYFPKGATIKFSSDSKGLGFICGNRELGGV